MALLTNFNGGMIRASGLALVALKRSGWQEVETQVSTPSPAPVVPAEKPKAAPRSRTRKTTPKTA